MSPVERLKVGVPLVLNWISLRPRVSAREWVLGVRIRTNLSPIAVCLVGTGRRKDRKEVLRES